MWAMSAGHGNAVIGTITVEDSPCFRFPGSMFPEVIVMSVPPSCGVAPTLEVVRDEILF
jgi:hypothetical protein